ncbi:MAG: pyridoxal-phosphate dependent enzyme [Acidobacteria bacterium]|nr:pyridoxal-phosphate dependent enzyme [Acidobacteriota bacterium]
MLGEGNTPLVESVRIGPALGVRRLLFKLEQTNPSGSYKDRFIAAEICRLLRLEARACVATSSGNTGSALAAYCARYGVECAIVVNPDAPAGKLAQMQAHGARLLRVRDFIASPGVTASVMRRLAALSSERGIPLVISAYRYCPEGMAGVESIARELARDCPSIDDIFVPVGGGGLFTAVCRGLGPPAPGARRPRVHAVQPAGCSTVVAAFERGDSEIRPVESTTCVSGLAVPFDIDASLALEHLRQSGGSGFAVSDREVYEAQGLLLRQEGIYCEPAGAAALAGLRQALARGLAQPDGTIVCLVTGHGFKDPQSIERLAAENPSGVIDESELEGRLVEMAA